MATIAAEQPAGHRRASAIRSAAGRVGMLVLVLAILWGLWEGYRWLWIREGWTWPFVVDSTTMPHIYDILRQLFRNPTSGAGGDILLVQLLHAAWFTAKEALVGFALGASFGFLLGVVLSQFRLLQRGLLPYVVASQTVPILAIAYLLPHSREPFTIAQMLDPGRTVAELRELQELTGDENGAQRVAWTDTRLRWFRELRESID